MSERNSWPFQEARRVLETFGDSDTVVFETGFGPSGNPHIGTFTEVARTTMVMNAFRQLSDKPARLIVYSDDMDGLRRVPDNVPNREMLEAHIGYPLSKVPCPYEISEYDGYPVTSFSGYNNAMLRSFLDQYNFEYEFRASSTEYYTERFSDVFLEVAENIDEITRIVTSTMKEDRRATYCPFMPIVDGRVVQDLYDWEVVRTESGSPAFLAFYLEPSSVDNRVQYQTPFSYGATKLQWYVDWAARWCALDIHYEMHGKDLNDSARISSQVCRAMGYEPPVLFQYELFLDEEGKKISKSKGNGMDLTDWWHYSTRDVLSFYLYHHPQKARKMYFDLIPQATEDYLRQLKVYNEEPSEDNPVWHVHSGNVPERGLPIQFSMLLNLVSITNTNDPEVIMNYIQTYLPNENLEDWPILAPLVAVALNYYQDRVQPFKVYRDPNADELRVLKGLVSLLETVEPTEEAITTAVYDLGKAEYGAENLRHYFGMVYEVLMGQKSGPRLPVFILIVGIENFSHMLKEVISQHD